jgi:hypothetical protein
MKTCTGLYLICLGILSITGIYSCEKIKSDSTLTGKAEFSVSIPANTGAKSISAPDSVLYTYQVMVSVSDMLGNEIITDKTIPLYSFGSEYVSENIEIKAGEYKLTKFMVVNSTGAVIFAAPVAGSPLAWLCDRPLPFSFTIRSGQVTRVIPQVLVVGDQNPDQFGYANFGMDIIKPLTFWTMAIIDNPLSMAPTLITQARLTIYAGNGWHYSYELAASVNQVVTRGGSDIYTFVVEKEGYLPLKLQITAKELLATSNDNPLVLKIPWDSFAYKTLTLQPGPEQGKDAMVSNLEPDKNFGSYKYFEATFLSESLLTPMRSNRSLIWFDLTQLPKSAIIKKVTLKLSYDLPIPWDNNIFPTATPGTSLWYGAVLQQIIEPWDEGTVTWNNQPKTIELNQVFVSPFIRNANFIELDVTTLFISSAANPLPNWGMLFRLFPTEKFPGFRFASSDFPDAALWPKLIVFYTSN